MVRLTTKLFYYVNISACNDDDEMCELGHVDCSYDYSQIHCIKYCGQCKGRT